MGSQGGRGVLPSPSIRRWLQLLQRGFGSDFFLDSNKITRTWIRNSRIHDSKFQDQFIQMIRVGQKIWSYWISPGSHSLKLHRISMVTGKSCLANFDLPGPTLMHVVRGWTHHSVDNDNPTQRDHLHHLPRLHVRGHPRVPRTAGLQGRAIIRTYAMNGIHTRW